MKVIRESGSLVHHKLSKDHRTPIFFKEILETTASLNVSSHSVE